MPLTIETNVSPNAPAAALLQHFHCTYGVWLCSGNKPRRAMHGVMTEACRAGMRLALFPYARLPLIPFWRYDLIILESPSCEQPATIVKAIRRVRLLSESPIVVLAPSVEQELLIASLNAGADAVSPVQTSTQVLLAHWDALLRRRAPRQSTNAIMRWVS
jgi:hypothetical protein